MPRLKSLFGFIRLFFLVESQRFVLWIDVIRSFCFFCDMFVPTVPSGRERLCRNSPFVFPSALHDGLAVSVKKDAVAKNRCRVSSICVLPLCLHAKERKYTRKPSAEAKLALIMPRRTRISVRQGANIVKVERRANGLARFAMPSRILYLPKVEYSERWMNVDRLV